MNWFSKKRSDSREARLNALVSASPVLRKDVDAINANRSAIQDVYKTKLISAMTGNDTAESILNYFHIDLDEYQATYSTFDVGSHNCPAGTSAKDQLDHDLVVDATLDLILMAAATELKMDMKKFKEALGAYLHLT